MKFKQHIKTLFLKIFIFVFLIACDKGLEPPEEIENAVIIGNIIYKGGISSWPAEDSVIAIRAAAFGVPPTANLINEVLQGNVRLTDPLNTFVETDRFELIIEDAPKTFEYIIVALQFEDNLERQLVIGVYTETGNKNQPSKIDLVPGDTIEIDIEVDFNELPPQPI